MDNMKICNGIPYGYFTKKGFTDYNIRKQYKNTNDYMEYLKSLIYEPIINQGQISGYSNKIFDDEEHLLPIYDYNTNKESIGWFILKETLSGTNAFKYEQLNKKPEDLKKLKEEYKVIQDGDNFKSDNFIVKFEEIFKTSEGNIINSSQVVLNSDYKAKTMTLKEDIDKYTSEHDLDKFYQELYKNVDKSLFYKTVRIVLHISFGGLKVWMNNSQTILSIFDTMMIMASKIIESICKSQGIAVKIDLHSFINKDTINASIKGVDAVAHGDAKNALSSAAELSGQLITASNQLNDPAFKGKFKFLQNDKLLQVATFINVFGKVSEEDQKTMLKNMLLDKCQKHVPGLKENLYIGESMMQDINKINELLKGESEKMNKRNEQSENEEESEIKYAEPVKDLNE
jgi:hypothetical protein